MVEKKMKNNLVVLAKIYIQIRFGKSTTFEQPVQLSLIELVKRSNWKRDKV